MAQQLNTYLVQSRVLSSSHTLFYVILKAILGGPYYFYFTLGEIEAEGWAALQNHTVKQCPQVLTKPSKCAHWQYWLYSESSQT